MSAVLEVDAVGKRYGEVQALADVGFSMGAGEIVAVIGPNGAGKTTLLSIIAGSLAPDAGSVSPAPERVGWAPQQPALYTRLTVAENLELFARLEGVPDHRAAVRAMLEQTELGERAGTLVGELSGGNRQRVNVALALIGAPPVLALDEPSASLDPAQRERLWRFVSGLAGQGTAIVFSTHNVNEAQRYAQRTIVLADGRMLFDGPPQELLAQHPEAGADLERALVLFLEARSTGAAAAG